MQLASLLLALAHLAHATDAPSEEPSATPTARPSGQPSGSGADLPPLHVASSDPCECSLHWTQLGYKDLDGLEVCVDRVGCAQCGTESLCEVNDAANCVSADIYAWSYCGTQDVAMADVQFLQEVPAADVAFNRGDPQPSPMTDDPLASPLKVTYANENRVAKAIKGGGTIVVLSGEEPEPPEEVPVDSGEILFDRGDARPTLKEQRFNTFRKVTYRGQPRDLVAVTRGSSWTGKSFVMSTDKTLAQPLDAVYLGRPREVIAVADGGRMVTLSGKLPDGCECEDEWTDSDCDVNEETLLIVPQTGCPLEPCDKETNTETRTWCPLKKSPSCPIFFQAEQMDDQGDQTAASYKLCTIQDTWRADKIRLTPDQRARCGASFSADLFVNIFDGEGMIEWNAFRALTEDQVRLCAAGDPFMTQGLVEYHRVLNEPMVEASPAGGPGAWLSAVLLAALWFA